MHYSSGALISIEGGEASGKSSLVQRLSGWLRSLSIEVVATREPGGTPSAEQIRQILKTSKLTPYQELELILIARRDHVTKIIAPAINRGDIVLCDRYFDSTIAYQSYGLGLDIHTTISRSLAASTVNGITYIPNLTLLLDLPAAIAAKRVSARGEMDGIEARGDQYHERVRQGFLEIASHSEGRVVKIDASRSENCVFLDAQLAILDLEM